MMRYFDPLGTAVQSAMNMFVIGVFFYFLIGTGHITIENTYYEELQQCELDLKNTQPICPSVQCSSNSSLGYLFSIFFGGLLMYVFYKGKEKEKSSPI